MKEGAAGNGSSRRAPRLRAGSDADARYTGFGPATLASVRAMLAQVLRVQVEDLIREADDIEAERLAHGGVAGGRP